MTQEDLKNLRVSLQEGKAIIGRDKVLKELRTGNLQKILLASNIPENMKNELEHYAKIGNVPIVVLEINNEELGIHCKKNFFVSVIGIFT